LIQINECRAALRVTRSRNVHFTLRYGPRRLDQPAHVAKVGCYRFGCCVIDVNPGRFLRNSCATRCTEPQAIERDKRSCLTRCLRRFSLRLERQPANNELSAAGATARDSQLLSMILRIFCYFNSIGGAGGIRTLDRALQPYNGLANRRLQPLGHRSVVADMPDTRASRKQQISNGPIFELLGLIITSPFGP
jgi:hypothetical protein